LEAGQRLQRPPLDIRQWRHDEHVEVACELAQFEEHLDWLIHGGGGQSYGEDSELAARYKALIGGLVELDEHLDSVELGGGVRRIPEILAEAIAVFNDRQEASTQS
jgi:hypothetical protein